MLEVGGLAALLKAEGRVCELGSAFQRHGDRLASAAAASGDDFAL